MKEDWYSTACRHADGTVTEIKVHISPEARRAAERETGDPEKMIESCFWRLIYLKSESKEVKGNNVEFTIDEPTILELISDLRKLRSAKTVCRTSKS